MSHVGLHTSILASRAQGAMLAHEFLRPLPMGLMPAVMSPRLSRMLDHLLIHQTCIAILLLPLVLRLNTLAIGRR
jgi:hypothetical protein